MQLKIVRLGEEIEVDVSDAALIRFPNGIVGFETIHEYALLPDPAGGIQWLHATSGDPVAFPVLDPFLVWPDYNLTVSDAEAERLGLERSQDAQVLAIITPRDDPEQISANLRAPLVVNRLTRIGIQIILQDAEYSVRTSILTALVGEDVTSDTDDVAPSDVVTKKQAAA